MMKTIYSIHPAIGIARVGNSDILDGEGSPVGESYYIGPESPGFEFQPGPYDDSGEGAGKYRDIPGNVRRQGARFRIYEKVVDDFDRVLEAREITSDMAKITWKVQVANKKGAAERFPPYFHDQWGEFGSERNPGVDQSELIVKMQRPKTITKGDRSRELHGKFLGKKVKLGNLLTDEHGRLVVLGGHGLIWGKKGSDGGPDLFRPGLPRHQVYNNDGICDDTSDGWITATVRFGDGQSVTIDKPEQRAWVIVGPPNFAPAVQSPVTLFDVVRHANLRHRERLSVPETVSFTRDIYPLLRRTVDLQWVSRRSWLGHSSGVGNFLSQQRLSELSSTSPDQKIEREYLVSKFTLPGAEGREISMPDLYGGVDPQNPRRKPVTNDPNRRDSYGIPLTITSYQREVFELWSKGFFQNDWQGTPTYPSLDEIDVTKQPDALDEAALEHGSGGSFHPGIEAPYILAQPEMFGSWFRIADGRHPGDLTEGLAVPWHTDFAACSTLWWPAQRPNVYPLSTDDGTEFVEWIRGIQRYEQLLELGFIKRDPVTGNVLELERVVSGQPPIG